MVMGLSKTISRIDLLRPGTVISLLFLSYGIVFTQPESALLDSARIYADSGRTADVERTALRALEALESTGKGDRDLIADAHYWIGFAQARLNKGASAKGHLLSALETYIANIDIEAQNRTYNALGFALLYISPDEAVTYAYKLLENCQNYYHEPNPETAEAHYLIGRYHSGKGNYDSVKYHVLQSIDILVNCDTIDHSELGDSYNSLGWYYENRGNMYEAKRAFERSDSHYRVEFPGSHLAHSNTYIALSIVLQAEQRYEEAISFALRALSIRKAKFGEIHPSTSYCYQLLGILYSDLGDNRRAMRYNRKCIAILDQTNGSDNRWSANIYNNQGNCYVALNMPDSADYCYRKAFRDNTRVLGPDNYEVVYPLKGLGDVFLLQDEPDSALHYFEECNRVCRKIYGPAYRTAIESLTAMAEILADKGDLSRSVALINAAVTSAGYQEEEDLPFAEVSYPVVLLEALRVRSAINRQTYDRTNTLAHLIAAHNDILTAETLIRHTRNSYNEVRSKQILAGTSLKTFEQGIDVALALFNATGERIYLETAFRYCEQNKSLTILEALQNARAERFAGVPDSAIQKVRQQQSAIAQLEYELSEAEGANGQKKSAKLGELKINYYEYLRSIESKYPKYYALKYSAASPSLEVIQEWLAENKTSLVEYFAGDSTLTTFAVTPDTILAVQQSIDQINDLAEQFSLLLKTPNSHLTEVISVSDSLYQLVVQPAARHLTSSLAVITDGHLGYVPFAALISRSGGSPHWLVEDRSITYHQSAALLLQDEESSWGSGAGMAAFAPSYPEDDNLIPLQYNTAEVKRIIKVTGGKSLVASEATLHNFRRVAAESRLLHLATHAKADDALGDNAYLVFSPGDSSSYLYVRDIYNMKIPSDLAVLSACQTGTGELRRGEGIISMARGFTYAGARAVLTTLWNVNDEVTAGIMKSFYNGLKKRRAKHEALSEAQRSFLEEIEDPQLAHPYYWAPYILIGDNAPVRSGPNTPWLLILGALATILAGLFAFRSFNRPNRS